MAGLYTGGPIYSGEWFELSIKGCDYTQGGASGGLIYIPRLIMVG